MFPFMDSNSEQKAFKLDDVSQPDSGKMEVATYEERKVSKGSKIQEKAIRELDKIKTIKMEQTHKKNLEEEIRKMKDER
jgi:hypothetical protein